VLAPYKEKQVAALEEFGHKVKQIADDIDNKYPYKEQIIK
jgi:hypothetical protein